MGQIDLIKMEWMRHQHEINIIIGKHARSTAYIFMMYVYILEVYWLIEMEKYGSTICVFDSWRLWICWIILDSRWLFNISVQFSYSFKYGTRGQETVNANVSHRSLLSVSFSFVGMKNCTGNWWMNLLSISRTSNYFAYCTLRVDIFRLQQLAIWYSLCLS